MNCGNESATVQNDHKSYIFPLRGSLPTVEFQVLIKLQQAQTAPANCALILAEARNSRRLANYLVRCVLVDPAEAEP